MNTNLEHGMFRNSYLFEFEHYSIYAKSIKTISNNNIGIISFIKRMFYCITILIVSITGESFAQKNNTTYDLFNYSEPVGFVKANGVGFISYTKTNKQNGTYCIVSLYSAIKKGLSITDGFNSEWNELVAKPFALKSKPNVKSTHDINGWETLIGISTFYFNGGTSTAKLYCYAKNGLFANVLILTNGVEYETDISSFVESVAISNSKNVSNETLYPISNSTSSNSAVNSNNKELLGEWYLSDGNIKIALAFAANGSFGRSFISESAKPIALNLYQTTSWSGSGKYTLNGNTLILSPKNSASEQYQIRFSVETATNGPIKILHLKRPVEGGQMYESDYYFVK
jgi:hypothetical protein